MTSYSRGEVLMVEIAFSGAPGRKRRPAVVMSADQYHHGGTKLIVAGLTSKLTTTAHFGNVPIRHWQEAGLIKPSMFRGVLMTVDELDVDHSMGMLAPTDFDALERAVAAILGFRIESP